MIIVVSCISLLFSQASKADDDDFQEFQEAPKPGVGDQTFSEFQGESAGSFPTTIAPPHQNRYFSWKVNKLTIHINNFSGGKKCSYL